LLGNFTTTTQANLQFDGTFNNTLPASILVDLNAACASPITYNWSIYALPPGSAASINPSNAAKPTMTLDAKGVYELSLVISDGVVTSAPIYMSLTGN
jgi:hypothetical protein